MDDAAALKHNDAPVCPICASADARFAFTKNHHQHFSCGGCGLLFLYPVPSDADLARIYDVSQSEQNSSMCWEGNREHLARMWERILHQISNRSGRGRLLDIGCGGGQFLAYARGKGWTDLLGIELSPQAAAMARETSGAVVHQCSLFDAPIEPGSLAAITIWDVIEHLRDPRAAVRHMRRLLRPGGVLALSTINRRGITLRLLGSKSLGVMPPEHLTYYTSRNLSDLLRSEGLQPIQVMERDIYVRDWVRFMSTTGDRVGDQRYKKTYGILTGGRLVRGVIHATNVVLDSFGLGDELVAIAVAG